MNAKCSTSGHCVKLGLWCAQWNHVLFCTNNIDYVITKSHDHTAETLFIFAVLTSPIRVTSHHSTHPANTEQLSSISLLFALSALQCLDSLCGRSQFLPPIIQLWLDSRTTLPIRCSLSLSLQLYRVTVLRLSTAPIQPTRSDHARVWDLLST